MPIIISETKYTHNFYFLMPAFYSLILSTVFGPKLILVEENFVMTLMMIMMTMLMMLMMMMMMMMMTLMIIMMTIMTTMLMLMTLMMMMMMILLFLECLRDKESTGSRQREREHNAPALSEPKIEEENKTN